MRGHQKIAFLKWGSFSHINASVLGLLQENFPDFQIEVIDFTDLIRRENAFVIYHCLREYGVDIIRGDKTFFGSIYFTPYVFRKARRVIQSRLSRQKYAFTFQTQSVFDASLPEIPHFVYTDHTVLANLRYPGSTQQNLFASAWIEYEKTIYQNSTLNFTMSSNIYRSIVEDYLCTPEKVSCVYCGANVQVTEDEMFDDSRFSGKNILFVGVDWHRKGGPVLAEAFKTVLGIYPDASLTIIGSTPRLNLPNCSVIGKIPLCEVGKYYRRASIFCLPTTREPFGVVFLEAMAHKLPVIATCIGAIPDFIHEDKNGYLVEPNDPERLAQKLIELIGSREKCKAFGEYGHRLFWDRYTWKKTGVRIREHIMPFLA